MLTSVSPGLHLVEWTKLSVDLSQIVAARKAQQSGPEVELSLQIGFSQTPVLHGERHVFTSPSSGWCKRSEGNSSRASIQ